MIWRQLETLLSVLWHYWCDKSVSFRKAALLSLLLCVVFFFLGRYYPEWKYQEIKETVSKIKDDNRLLAKELSQRNGWLQNLRAKNELHKKTIDLLKQRIHQQEKKNIAVLEQSTSYEQILFDKLSSGNVLIHAIETKVGYDNTWNISAVLIALSRKKEFSGAYYMEIIEKTKDNQHHIIRIPKKGTIPIKIQYHYKIEEEIEISPQAIISNIHLFVTDNKGKLIASDNILEGRI